MKKFFKVFLLLVIAFLFSINSASAACTPPSDYSSCPEQNPDYNLSQRGYEPIGGSLSLIGFDHDIDPSAPQLATLIEGNPVPEVSSLYQVYDWGGGLYQKQADAPSDFASLVGFSTQTGQGVLVPSSGYDIGGGYEATVLFADSDSITLKYGTEDSVVTGYTLHLENFRVDPRLVSFYNQLNQEGREQLPVLTAGAKIGEAISTEVLVAIRDTGSFMDPRWINDWWQTLDPAIIQELIFQGILVMAVPQGYGACNSETPGDEGAGIAWGNSFEAEVSSLPWESSEEEKLSMTLRGLEFEFPENEESAFVLEKSNEKLTPAGYSPKISQKTAMGEVWYEVCDLDNQEIFTVKGDLGFKTPNWMDFTSSLGTSLENFFISSGASGGYTQNIKTSQVAGKTTTLAQGHECSADKSYEIVPSCAQCKDVLFCWGNKYRLCETDPQIPNPEGNLTQWLSPGDFPSGTLRYNDASFNVPGGGVFVCDSNAYGCSNDCFDKQGGPPPSPDFCDPYSSQGDNQLSTKICIGGQCKKTLPPDTFFQWVTDQLTKIQELIFKPKTFLVTPVIKTPHALNIDNTLRANVFSTFKPSNFVLEFKHTLTPALHEVSGSSEEYNSDSEIYGQKGVQEADDWVHQALTPSALLSL